MRQEIGEFPKVPEGSYELLKRTWKLSGGKMFYHPYRDIGIQVSREYDPKLLPGCSYIELSLRLAGAKPRLYTEREDARTISWDVTSQDTLQSCGMDRHMFVRDVREPGALDRFNRVYSGIGLSLESTLEIIRDIPEFFMRRENPFDPLCWDEGKPFVLLSLKDAAIEMFECAYLPFARLYCGLREAGRFIKNINFGRGK